MSRPPNCSMSEGCRLRRSERSSRPHFGVLEPFTKHRRLNAPIARTLAKDPETAWLAKRIANCSGLIKLDIEVPDGFEPKAHLKGAKVCDARLCPFCEWRRTKAWRRRLITGLEGFHEVNPTWRAVFLTLTVRNCALGDLRKTLKQMQEGWNRFRGLSFFPTSYWFKRTEITVGASPGGAGLLGGPLMAHPHFHVMLLVPPSYFGKKYVKQTRWQQEWEMAMRLDYTPVIDVRAAKSKKGSGGSAINDSKAAAIEAAKYASKATQLLELGDALTEFHFQTQGVRYYSVSRDLKQFISDGEIKKSEMIDNTSPDPEGDIPLLKATAAWFEDSQEYLFTNL